MNSYILKLAPFFGRLDRRHIRLFLTVLYLALLVIGAGAPGAGGGMGL